MAMEEVDSSASGKASDISHCASCCVAELDDIKLTTCTANCNLVRYCSIACQVYHRSQHEATCKERVAELRDDLLFTQPEGSCYGDCPICCLPMPLQNRKRVPFECCSKLICDGCAFAEATCSVRTSAYMSRKEFTCPFCRHQMQMAQAEAEHEKNSLKHRMRRAEANDPVAMFSVGKDYCFEGNYTKAIHYWRKAARLEHAESHYHLSLMYLNGKGVEKDEKKLIHHSEEAAIAGHPLARFNLGAIELNDGRTERAMKHFIIAANLGDDNAVKELKKGYVEGLVSKEDFASALRAHQAAVYAMKSPQRKVVDELDLDLEPKVWNWNAA